MSNIILRPYQSLLNQAIKNAWNVGLKNLLMVLPTGGGKTVSLADIVDKEPGAVCVIAHRQELVSQISLALARNGIRHRIVGPKKVIQMIVSIHMTELGRSFYDGQSHIGVAGVDTLIRRKEELARWLPTVKLWVVDEAHHLLSDNKWGTAVEMFPNARGLGVTATPLRADGKGLSAETDGEFHGMVVGPTMRELIDQGYLTEYKIYAPVSNLNFDNVKVSKTTGDYIQNQQAKVISQSSLITHDSATVTGDVVSHYLRIAPGKLGITFVPDMDTGRELEKQFNDAGVPAKLVNAKTPDDERAAILRQFANKEYLQLINVDLFGEGFDLPAIEVVSMVRRTLSYGLYIQMFGRVLRILAGKEYGIVIDHVGNVAHHGLPDAYREWDLAPKSKRSKKEDDDVMPVTSCINCSAVYERYKKSCPECGYVPVPAVRTEMKYVDGDLSELSPEVLAQMRGEIVKADRPIMEQLAEYRIELQNKYTNKIHEMAHVKRLAGKLEHQQESQKILRDKMAWWAGYRRSEGLTDAELFKMFYLKYGVDWVTAQTLPGDEADKLIAKVGASIQ